MIRLENIKKVYNAGTVDAICLFDGLDLTVNDGDFISVVGSNGSGKTSLLNIICGNVAVDGGKISIDGDEITSMKDFKRYRRIGRVYQNPAMGTCPSMTILENMSLADNKGKAYGLGWGTDKKRIEGYRESLRQ